MTFNSTMQYIVLSFDRYYIQMNVFYRRRGNFLVLHDKKSFKKSILMLFMSLLLICIILLFILSSGLFFRCGREKGDQFQCTHNCRRWTFFIIEMDDSRQKKIILLPITHLTKSDIH